MIDREIKIKYNEICQNLADRKLKPAFDLLEKWIGENNLLIYLDEWRNLEQTYSYMLKYTVEGIQDPERQKIYRKLIVSVYELADVVYNTARLKISSSVEYERKRSTQNMIQIDFGSYLQLLEEFYLHEELVSLAKDVEVKIESKLERAKITSRA